MTSQLIQFIALVLLMLVTGIFFGPWFALHRSMKFFSETEFIHIVKNMSKNLAVPMRIIIPCCILFMSLAVYTYPQKDFVGFYLIILALMLTIISLIITIVVEVPIVKQIEQWTPTTVPLNWRSIQDRWLTFHVIRTFASLISFASFAASILFLQSVIYL
jgi:uncharacterized membrane protein